MRARGGSPPRPTAITPVKFARALPTATGHAHYPGGAMLARGGSPPTARGGSPPAAVAHRPALAKILFFPYARVCDVN